MGKHSVEKREKFRCFLANIFSEGAASAHLPALVLQGMTLLMMGSAEALPEEPAVRPMFVEDMTEEQLASAVSQSLHYQCSRTRCDTFLGRPRL